MAAAEVDSSIFMWNRSGGFAFCRVASNLTPAAIVFRIRFITIDQLEMSGTLLPGVLAGLEARTEVQRRRLVGLVAQATLHRSDDRRCTRQPQVDDGTDISPGLGAKRHRQDTNAASAAQPPVRLCRPRPLSFNNCRSTCGSIRRSENLDGVEPQQFRGSSRRPGRSCRRQTDRSSSARLIVMKRIMVFWSCLICRLK